MDKGRTYEGRQRPPQTQDTRFFWEGAREHRLRIQRCARCHKLRHPPTPSCDECGSLAWDAVDACGMGTLFSYTVVHSPIVPPFEKPYTVGVIQLEEGTRLVAGVSVPPDDLKIGMALRVAWIDDPEVSVPIFVPVDSLE